ncbi:MAG: ATP-binding protein [Saprospiraceae bacterium]
MKFNNRFYYLVFGVLAMFLMAKGLETIFSPHKLVQQYAQQITNNLQQKEQKISQTLADEAFVTGLFSNVDSTSISAIESLAENHFNICLYQADSLVFWSNSSIAFPDKNLLKTIAQSTTPIFKKLSNGYFVIQKWSLPYSNSPNQYAVSLIPIKWQYTKSLAHLRPHFEASLDRTIPDAIDVSTQATNFPILSETGSSLFYLKVIDKFKDKGLLMWLLILYTIAFLLLGILINKVAKKVINKNQPWAGPSFLLVTVFGLRYLSLDWSTKFQEFQVFSRSFDNPNVSVGDLLINIILLLWVVIFIHRESKDRDFAVNLSTNTRFFLTTMNYLSVVLALLLLISVLKSLVLNSGIDFDFKNVFSLDHYSIIAVFGVILLLFTQFVFSHRMMITIHKLNLERSKRLVSLGVAIILALPIIIFIDLAIPLHYTALLGFIFVIFYDLFIDIPNPGLVWLSLWVILFAGFSSSLLYNYNTEKELKKEIFIAQQLAEEKDTLAELAIVNFKITLDSSFQNNSSSIANLLDESEANAFYATLNFKQNYLYTNYEYQVYQYNEFGKNQINDTDSISINDWQKKLTQATPIKNHANIYLHQNTTGKYSYLLLKKLPNLATGSHTPQLIFEFKKAKRKRSKVYTNILSHQEFKGLTDLAKYDYAIIKDGKEVIEEGLQADAPNFTIADKPEIGQYVKRIQEELVYFMYRSAENDFVLLSKPKNNLFYPFSLFSFIFGFLALMVVVIAIINSKITLLPDNLSFQFWNKPSLKNRIQFSTILLTLASFLIIGVVSVYLLTTSYQSYEKGRLKRKVGGVQTSAEQYLHQAKDSLALLSAYVVDLSKAERIDFNLFDLNGKLIQSSEMDIFKRGVLPPRMNAHAFELLKRTDKSDLVQSKKQESITDEQKFISAFKPIVDSKGKRVAYIGVPYANQQRTLEDDVLNFMGNLVNVYVFMLILAGGISVWVANTITRPITTIGENLKELKLGKSNEPLQWRTNDEIGVLVTDYNRMIVKLEHSAKLLARSEREGAWREMAKQVAHEIKNPLTPMKLSIQYLTHAFKSNPDNIEPLLKRVSNTLIEQIDSLAQIADEFSNFAKMPRANNQQIKLNDLVESVHDLFKKSENTDVLLSLPQEVFYVFADKNHLVRVLNNMVKNAIEAIPDSRRGQIDVSLTKEEDIAVIKVKDNGVGIPDEMKEKVFVPNFTTKNSGTGLGLAISKNIIESVNGRIYFETEKDVGTTFFVELPLEDMVLEE